MNEVSQNSEKNSVSLFRESFEELINYINKIAINPIEKISIPPEIMAGLPLRWDLHQIYFLIENYYSHHPFSSISFVIVDDNLQILDFCEIATEFIEELDNIGNLQSFLQLSIKFIDKSDKFQDFFTNLQSHLDNYEPIQELINEFLEKNYSIATSRSIILPKNYKRIISKIIPDFNHDALSTIKELVDLKNVFQYLGKKKKSKMNYVLSQFSYNLSFKNVEKSVKRMKNVDFEQWARILTTLYDDSIENLIIYSKKRKKPLIGLKFIITNHRLSVNPLPNILFKEFYNIELPLIQIAEKIHNKTGLRTQVIDESEIFEFLEKCNDPSNDLFDIFTFCFELAYSTTWYPDSLLNSFLKLFGLQLGPGIGNFNQAFRTVIEYFENVLLLTYQKNEEKNKIWATLVQMGIKDGKAFLKIIESKGFDKLLKKNVEESPETFRKFTKEVEKKVKTHFKACFGFNIDLLTDSLSAKNIQALLSMNHIAHQLPFIATLGGLFAGMKGMKADTKEMPLIQIYDEPTAENLTVDRMKFATYFDDFLKKGIFFISDEEKAMESIRSPLYSKEGYLGIDMEALRNLMLKNSQKLS
ncbi:hypothetical protein [Candidatus Lokiarchaeum ossiferum]|uniref:hypothetical protein n=1 Tax=Candidatus Lokiarchaeum ossiferum TaxID=2951803 RepID=UPI00352DAF79